MNEGQWYHPGFFFTKKNARILGFGKNAIIKKSDGVFQSISTEINDVLQ